MLIPGVDFTTIGKAADGVLRLRERQRRHPRPPDQVHPLQRAARTRPGGGARQEADRERQGRRHRRQHELRRVRHELEVLQEQGLRRDRRGRAGGVLQHAVLRRGERRPALQQHRRRAGARQGRRQEARDRLAGHDLGVRGRRPALVAKAAGIPVQGLPDPPAGHGRELAAAPDVPVRRRRRRHPARLHPGHRPGVHEGRRGSRASSTRCCGARRPRSRTRSCRASSRRLRRSPLDRQRVLERRPEGRPRLGADVQRAEEVRARRSPRRRSRRWASWTRSSRRTRC